LNKNYSLKIILILLILITAKTLVAKDYNEVFFPQVIVLDGDSIEINNKRIRLFGIDAPEYEQTCTKDKKEYPCGKIAFKKLKEIIGSNDVNCLTQDIDKYKREVSICFAGHTDINAKMVSSGWATAYRYYTKKYAREEDEAKSKKLGIWAGEFEQPYTYRKKHPRKSR